MGLCGVPAMTILVSRIPDHRWQEYRDIRLMALAFDPNAFCSTYEEEKKFSKSDWQLRQKNMWFALVDEKIVGLIGLIKRPYRASQHIGDLVSLWVKPEYRGQGIAQRLVACVQEQASLMHMRKISLQATVEQIDAINLYEKMGFCKIGLLKEEIKTNDGRFLDEYYMEWLALKNDIDIKK